MKFREKFRKKMSKFFLRFPDLPTSQTKIIFTEIYRRKKVKDLMFYCHNVAIVVFMKLSPTLYYVPERQETIKHSFTSLGYAYWLYK